MIRPRNLMGFEFSRSAAVASLCREKGIEVTANEVLEYWVSKIKEAVSQGDDGRIRHFLNCDDRSMAFGIRLHKILQEKREQ